MSDFFVQHIPIWSTVKPQTRHAILRQGKLAGQPTKLMHPHGCKRGGGDCFHCKIVPCGGTIPCCQCTVKDCHFETPCIMET